MNGTVEGTLLLLLPAFIIYSLYRHIPRTAYIFFFILLAASVKFVHARHKSLWKVFLLYVFVLTVIVFIAGTWTICKIDGLRIFPDTGVYVKVSELNALSQKFIFRGMRTFVTPAVFKAFQRDWPKINIFYIERGSRRPRSILD